MSALRGGLTHIGTSTKHSGAFGGDTWFQIQDSDYGKLIVNQIIWGKNFPRGGAFLTFLHKLCPCIEGNLSSLAHVAMPVPTCDPKWGNGDSF